MTITTITIVLIVASGGLAAFTTYQSTKNARIEAERNAKKNKAYKASKGKR